MNRPLKLSLAVALALGHTSAFALGLGSISVKSGLNQPLLAEIPVTLSSPDETEGLKADLASESDFNRVGLSIANVPVRLNVKVISKPGGETVILVTSNDPVRETFLSFMVDVNWAKGRVLREYSVLLDPPDVVPAIVSSSAVVAAIEDPAPVVMQTPLEEVPAVEMEAIPEPEPEVAMQPDPVPEAAEIAPTPEPVVEAQRESATQSVPEPEPAVVPEPWPEPVAAIEPEAEPPPAMIAQPEFDTTTEQAPAEASAPSSDYGPVASGETLWEIASATKPTSSVNINQMMVSILRANPDAFFRDNINALKRGAILRIPSEEEVRALSMAQAASEVLAQNQSWAGISPTLLANATAPADSRSSSTFNESTNADSRLALVPPSEGASVGGVDRPGTAGGTGDAQIKNQLATTKEQLTSAQQENTELESRVAELEKLKGTTDKLVSLKNNEVADLQNQLLQLRTQLAELEAKQKAEAAAAATQPVPDPDPIAMPVQPEVEVASIEEATTPESEVVAEVTAASPALDSEVAAEEGEPIEDEPTITALEESAAEIPVVVTPTPTAQAWYQNNWILGGGTALAGLLAFLAFRRRGSSSKDLEDGVPRSSVADQFGDEPYGAGVQEGNAERTLLELLSKDPTDTDAHLDLLRLYYVRGEQEQFEAAAGAMYAQVPDASHPAWQVAIAMGRDLSPDNPLFSEGAFANSEDNDYSNTREMDAVQIEDEQGGFVTETSGSGKADDFDFDFDLTQDQSFSASKPIDDDLDLASLNATGGETSVGEQANEAFDGKNMQWDDKQQEQELSSVASADGSDVKAPASDSDLDLPDFKLSDEPAELAASASEPGFDMQEIDDAAGSADDDIFSRADAVATKLDLARAYLDMGDPEGAKSMLNEVLNEGNEAQKSEAQRLLSEAD